MKRIRMACTIILLLSIALAVRCKIEGLSISDSLPPTITMDETTKEISIKDDTSVLLEGVKATDRKDGDVTYSLVIESVSDFLSDGRRLVTYVAFDSDSHAGKATRQITYSDYTAPKFQLNAPLMFPSNGKSDLFEHMTVKDCLDGNISSSIKLSSGYSVYMDTPGDYEVQLEVTNSAGDTVVLPVTVTVYDSSDYNNSPQITLKDYIVYTKKGDKLNLDSYVDEVSSHGTVLEGKDANVEIVSDHVDYDTPGTYEAVYKKTDDSGNVGSVRLIIVVEE